MLSNISTLEEMSATLRREGYHGHHRYNWGERVTRVTIDTIEREGYHGYHRYNGERGLPW